MIFHARGTALTTPDTQFRLGWVTSKFTLPCLDISAERVQNRVARFAAVGLKPTPEALGLGPTAAAEPPSSVGAWVSPPLVSRPTIPVAGQALFWRDLKSQPPVTPSEKQIVSKKPSTRREEARKWQNSSKRRPQRGVLPTFKLFELK